MTDRISIRGIRAWGRHGFSHELHHAQPFEVDVDMFLDLSDAAATDDLGKTIDYSLVTQEVRRAVEEESFSLVESLANAIADRLIAYGAGRVTVRVSKPAAAMSLGVTELSIEITRPSD